MLLQMICIIFAVYEQLQVIRLILLLFCFLDVWVLLWFRLRIWVVLSRLRRFAGNITAIDFWFVPIRWAVCRLCCDWSVLWCLRVACCVFVFFYLQSVEITIETDLLSCFSLYPFLVPRICYLLYELLVIVLFYLLFGCSSGFLAFLSESTLCLIPFENACELVAKFTEKQYILSCD